jgi:outer membrane protein assembly factor BamB
MVVYNDMLYIKNGTGSLLGLNKNTGAIAWTKSSPSFNQPIVGNNLIYSAGSDYNVYAFNPVTGSLVSQWNTNLAYTSGQPYLSGQSICVAGQANTQNFIASYNFTTSTQNWKSFVYPFCTDPVVVGSTIYATGYPTANTAEQYIFMFDNSTGHAKDSILLTGEEFGMVNIITSSGSYASPN